MPAAGRGVRLLGCCGRDIDQHQAFSADRGTPADAFAFFLIDPKSWRIPLKTLSPMLERPHSEVIFNFMFGFINRAVSIKDAAVVSGLNELIPHRDWRAKLVATEGSHPGGLDAEQRKAILVDAFASNLATLGKYAQSVPKKAKRP
jgi:hypothetical protein